jgi:acyl-homoserine-lactone acylase
MNYLKNLTLILMLILLMGMHPASQMETKEPKFPKKGYVRIIRDDYGVPHVYALRERDLYYGFGYAMAADRLKQMFTTLNMGLGRLAELQGETALSSDIFFRSFDLARKAKLYKSRLSSPVKAMFRAHIAGIKAYIKEHRQKIPAWITDEFGLDEICQVMLAATILRRSGNTGERPGDLPAGSNTFAISGSRAKRKKPILIFDPHTAYSGFTVLYEAHLITPDYSVIGMNTPGSPRIDGGFNGKVAFGGTANFPDETDTYKFQINPQNSDLYLNYDGWRTFQKLEETFKIKTGTGFRTETRTILVTHVGPVTYTQDGYAYATRLADYESAAWENSFYKKNKVSTVQQFFNLLKVENRENHNYIAADTKGNIGYFYTAYLPLRNEELDWSQPVAGEDPRSEWQGYLPASQLPRVINPASGWLQSANDDHWQVTENSGISENLPFRLTFPRITTRGIRFRELLSGDPMVTSAEAQKYATDTLMIKARFWAPILVGAFDLYADSMSLRGTDTETAINLFRNWNYRAETDSKAMTVFFYWFDVGNTELRPIESTDEVTEEIKQDQLTKLGNAASYIKSKHGRVDITWGEVQYLEHGGQKYPLAGSGGWFPPIRAIWSPPREDGYLKAIGGSSFCMVIELTNKTKFFSSLPFGQSEDPNSPHFNDMTKLFSQKKFKPVYYTWKQLRKHIESDVTISTRKKK